MVFAAIMTACAALSGPQNISSLLDLVYSGSDTPTFTPLPSLPNVAIARNDTANLQIHDLVISPYPLKPGHVKFWLSHELLSKIPPDSRLKISSFVGDEPGFNGEVDLCSYTKFAKFECPIEKYIAPETIERTLLVPDDANPGRFSFIAEAITPENELITTIAAIIDLENTKSFGELGNIYEEQTPVFPHDEL